MCRSQAATECLAGLPAEEEGDGENTDPICCEIKGLGCCSMWGGGGHTIREIWRVLGSGGNGERNTSRWWKV